MVKNLTDDLSKVCNADRGGLNKLFGKAGDCIVNAVYESTLRGEEETTVDLGFGQLIFYSSDSSLKIRFVPSENMAGELKKAADGEPPKMHTSISKALAQRLLDMAREF